MVVGCGETYLGVLGMIDTPREAARKVITLLRELGIRCMIMLSGINQQVADAVAKEVGIDEALGRPDGKSQSRSNQETQQSSRRSHGWRWCE